MTAGYINFNKISSVNGQKLNSALKKLKEGRDELTYILGTMTQMIDGDGSDPAQFTELVTQFGFDTNPSAKACYSELQADIGGQLNSTSVKAALDQLFAKLS